MITSRVLIVSERRLMAEAYANVLSARAGCSISIEQSIRSMKGIIAINPNLTVLLDLERLGWPVGEVVALLEVHRGRRCGFYDRFTAGIAELAFELGAGNLIAPSASVEEIVSAVTEEHSTTVTRGSGLTRAELDQLARLSPRELEVLRLVAQGLSASRIAATLGITSHTVQTHRRRAMRKLDTVQQSQAVALLARAGVLVTTQN